MSGGGIANRQQQSQTPRGHIASPLFAVFHGFVTAVTNPVSQLGL